MGNAIDKISVINDVALITFRNLPADMRFISHIFDMIAKKDINVDMIAQTAPVDERTEISFTVPDEMLEETYDILAQIHESHPEIRTDISNANCKITIFGEPMRFTPGIAADVFNLIADLNIDVRSITTSEIEISLLIPKAEYNIVASAFKEKFEIKIQQ